MDATVTGALLGGPQRFNDPPGQIPGIAANILSERLKRPELGPTASLALMIEARSPRCLHDAPGPATSTTHPSRVSASYRWSASPGQPAKYSHKLLFALFEAVDSVLTRADGLRRIRLLIGK